MLAFPTPSASPISIDLGQFAYLHQDLQLIWTGLGIVGGVMALCLGFMVALQLRRR